MMKLHGPSRTSTLSRRGSPTPLKPVSGVSTNPILSTLAKSNSHDGHSHGTSGPQSFASLYAHPIVTHTYRLEQASFPYVTLSLNSGASSPEQMPVFHGQCPVTGEVVLEQSKLRSIKDVMITVEGRLFTPSGEVTSFLSHTLSLLTPALPQPAPRTSTLDGTHTLPFSFTFPSVGSNGSPLPTSWTSALSPNTKIEYVFSLRIKRKSRAARRVCGDDVLNVPIIFHPRPRPEKQPLVSWSAAGTSGEWPTDRSAWHLSTATVRGTQLGQRDVSLRATLALAAPLAYPVRTTLPFTITLSDEANVAPDVLDSPIAIAVDLRRAVRYVPTAIPHPVSVWCVACGFAMSKCICPKKCTPSHSHSHGKHDKNHQEWTWETVSVANCWQVRHAAQNVRLVRGEIQLSASSTNGAPLEPSFTFGGLDVSYAVHVRFAAPGKEDDQHFTFVEPVTLVPELGAAESVASASGSRPYSTSTPSMTTASSSSSAASSSYAPSVRATSPPPAISSKQREHQVPLSRTNSYDPPDVDLPPSYACSQVQAGYGWGVGAAPSAIPTATAKRPLPAPPQPQSQPQHAAQTDLYRSLSQTATPQSRSAPPSPPYSRASSEERELQLPVSAYSRAPCGALRVGEQRPWPGYAGYTGNAGTAASGLEESWMRMRVAEDDPLLA